MLHKSGRVVHLYHPKVYDVATAVVARGEQTFPSAAASAKREQRPDRTACNVAEPGTVVAGLVAVPQVVGAYLEQDGCVSPGVQNGELAAS